MPITLKPWLAFMLSVIFVLARRPSCRDAPPEKETRSGVTISAWVTDMRKGKFVWLSAGRCIAVHWMPGRGLIGWGSNPVSARGIARGVWFGPLMFSYTSAA